MSRCIRKLATALVTCVFAFSTSAATAQQNNGRFQTAPVFTTAIGGQATVGGTVIPYKQVTLMAQMPGRVTYIAGAEGHNGTQGDILVQINDDTLQAQRRAAEAEVLRAEAALRNSQMQYTRELYSPRTNSVTAFPGMGLPSTFDQFFTRGFSSVMGQSNPGLERQADLYSQGSGVSQAESGLLRARAALEEIDSHLRDSRAVAPFDGIVVAKHIEVGDTVQPGMPLVTYAYVEYLRIEADVPVRLAAGLADGMMVPARLDVGGIVEAKVAQIYPVADPGRHTVKVKFDLPKETPGGPGMYVEVTIPDISIPVRNQPSVPQEALIRRGSLPAVFVLENGEPSLRVVRVGYPMPDGRIAIVSGLNGGEQVILNPPANLISGH